MDTARRLEQLCDVAARLFSQRGYHGTTVREIARELDLQGGSLYAHISGKEDLLWAICERAADQFQAAVAPVAAAELPADLKLRAALQAHVRVVAANLAAAAVYFHEWRCLNAARVAAIRARRDAHEAVFRGIIAEGRRSGRFVAPDTKFPTLLVLSAGNWLAQWYRADGELDAEAAADRLADLILGGLCPATASHPATSGANGRAAGPDPRPAVEVTT